MGILGRITSSACILSLCLLAGCVSTKTGTKIETDKVTQIQKGVTTRSQVEALLGPPTAVSMMGDGRRMLVYHGSESKGHVNSLMFVPLVGSVLPDASKNEVRRQSLQIILSKADIVEDYEFSDTTSKDRRSGSLLTGQHTEVETTQNK